MYGYRPEILHTIQYDRVKLRFTRKARRERRRWNWNNDDTISNDRPVIPVGDANGSASPDMWYAILHLLRRRTGDPIRECRAGTLNDHRRSHVGPFVPEIVSGRSSPKAPIFPTRPSLSTQIAIKHALEFPFPHATIIDMAARRVGGWTKLKSSVHISTRYMKSLGFCRILMCRLTWAVPTFRG
jgi:hypothetical protein